MGPGVLPSLLLLATGPVHPVPRQRSHAFLHVAYSEFKTGSPDRFTFSRLICGREHRVPNRVMPKPVQRTESLKAYDIVFACSRSVRGENSVQKRWIQAHT